jgi:hypothetical protein
MVRTEITGPAKSRAGTSSSHRGSPRRLNGCGGSYHKPDDRERLDATVRSCSKLADWPATFDAADDSPDFFLADLRSIFVILLFSPAFGPGRCCHRTEKLTKQNAEGRIQSHGQYSVAGKEASCGSIHRGPTCNRSALLSITTLARKPLA